MQGSLEGWEWRGNIKKQYPEPSETQMSEHLGCSETGAEPKPYAQG